jgi:hypothetical protein
MRARPIQVRQKRVVAVMRALASSVVAGEASPSAHDSEQYISSPVPSVCRPRTLSPSVPRGMLACRRSLWSPATASATRLLPSSRVHFADVRP